MKFDCDYYWNFLLLFKNFLIWILNDFLHAKIEHSFTLEFCKLCDTVNDRHDINALNADIFLFQFVIHKLFIWHNKQCLFFISCKIINFIAKKFTRHRQLDIHFRMMIVVRFACFGERMSLFVHLYLWNRRMLCIIKKKSVGVFFSSTVYHI